MKTSLIAFTVLGLAMTAGCNNRDGTGDETTMTPAGTASTTAAADTSPAADHSDMRADSTPVAAENTADMDDAAARTGDPLALGMLAAVDEHEIAAAKQAQEKGVTGAVLDYAKRMEKEHGDNLTKTRALGSLGSSADLQAMKDKDASDLQALGGTSGKDYEKSYIDAMVKGHQDALDLIDNKMMPAATSEAVRQHLTETRKHVAAHLAGAKTIAAKQ